MFERSSGKTFCSVILKSGLHSPVERLKKIYNLKFLSFTMKQWILLLFALIFSICVIKADKFLLVLPDGEKILGDVTELNDLVDEKFREYFEDPVIQEQLQAKFNLVAKEVPRFHELVFKKEKLTIQEENELTQLLYQVVRKYYKKILKDAFALGGIQFTLIETDE